MTVEGKDDGVWFAAKTYGFGAGLPIAWQGWVLLIGFIPLLLADMAWVRPRWLAVALAVVLIVGFSLIAAQHTEGGWRWRWGGD